VEASERDASLLTLKSRMSSWRSSAEDKVNKAKKALKATQAELEAEREHSAELAGNLRTSEQALAAVQAERSELQNRLHVAEETSSEMKNLVRELKDNVSSLRTQLDTQRAHQIAREIELRSSSEAAVQSAIAEAEKHQENHRYLIEGANLSQTIS